MGGFAAKIHCIQRHKELICFITKMYRIIAKDSIANMWGMIGKHKTANLQVSSALQGVPFECQVPSRVLPQWPAGGKHFTEAG